ncbi:MAG: UDP-2,3-diacylglucosamine diphosphatase LpxI [Caulobacteraceae bacterium]|nr:UDP-2,3-diacylglucosamine diphosphatase LpxI [Caulobacteraceae bacterium]
MSKLGLIAGGGGLPLEIARSCVAAERPFFIIRVKGFADAALAEFPGVEAGLAELGKAIKALKAEHCQTVCFAGQVNRPDFTALKPDLRGMAAVPGAIAAARRGDDGLLRFIMGEFEREGFTVAGVDQVVQSLTLPLGQLGRHGLTEAAQLDVETAMRAARALGSLDIGQAAVSARGLVLAVEAAEGTAAMLARCAELPPALRGTAKAPAGVLAKAPKPFQDRRVDLPTIGAETVVAAHRAGLAGIVGEAGALLVVDRAAVIEMADALGLFVVGLRAEPVPPRPSQPEP